MTVLLNVLAALGILAVVLAGFRAVLRMLHGGVEAFVASEVASVRAGRGDLTGMSQAEERRATLRRTRRLYALQVLAWFVLLLAPLFTPWTRELYAGYAVLWLIPRRRVRPPAAPT
jgi:hypothetical protein